MLNFWLRTASANIASKIKNLIKNEEGDTNFISIIIILGIVILVAGIFIGFKDQIVSEVQGIIDGFSLVGGDTK